MEKNYIVVRKTFYPPQSGVREGCWPVVQLVSRKGSRDIEEIRRFTIDAPGAWFPDSWNCHVDGCDNEFKTLKEAVEYGCLVCGIKDYILTVELDEQD